MEIATVEKSRGPSALRRIREGGGEGDRQPPAVIIMEAATPSSLSIVEDPMSAISSELPSTPFTTTLKEEFATTTSTTTTLTTTEGGGAPFVTFTLTTSLHEVSPKRELIDNSGSSQPTHSSPTTALKRSNEEMSEATAATLEAELTPAPTVALS